MINFLHIISIIGSIFGILSYSVYIYSVKKDNKTPHPLTFGLITISNLTVITTYLLANQTTTAISLTGFALGSLILFILSLKQRKLTTKETNTLFLAILAAIVVNVYSNIYINVSILSILAIYGAIPTLRKSYIKPDSECLLAWILGLISSLSALITLGPVPSWNITEAILPLIYFLNNLLVIICIIYLSRLPIVKEIYKKLETKLQ